MWASAVTARDALGSEATDPNIPARPGACLHPSGSGHPGTTTQRGPGAPWTGSTPPATAATGPDQPATGHSARPPGRSPTAAPDRPDRPGTDRQETIGCGYDPLRLFTRTVLFRLAKTVPSPDSSPLLSGIFPSTNTYEFQLTPESPGLVPIIVKKGRSAHTLSALFTGSSQKRV